MYVLVLLVSKAVACVQQYVCMDIYIRHYVCEDWKYYKGKTYNNYKSIDYTYFNNNLISINVHNYVRKTALDNTLCFLKGYVGMTDVNLDIQCSLISKRHKGMPCIA